MNVEGLTVDLERCPDGVELVDLPVVTAENLALRGSDAVSVEASFRYRTDRRQTDQKAIENLENPIVISLVNAVEAQQLRLFFERFGLGSHRDEWLWNQPGSKSGRYHLKESGAVWLDCVRKYQTEYRQLLRIAGGEDRASAMAAINSAIEKTTALEGLVPTFHLAGPRGNPRLLLKTKTLLGFMMMEIAMIVAHGVRVTECENCNTVFLTGPLTWRRAHARFCSDTCRVAAHRARKATTGDKHVS